jgi:hypothetical protein
MKRWFRFFRAASNDAAFENYVKEEEASYLILASLALVAAMVIGIGYSVYRIYMLVSLELIYMHRYGLGWQIQYEKDHGSLSHAQAQIVVGVMCLLSLVAIVIWFYRVSFLKRRRESKQA